VLQIVDSSIDHLAKFCPHLEKLYLSKCYRLSSRTFKTISKVCKTILYICISWKYIWASLYNKPSFIIWHYLFPTLYNHLMNNFISIVCNITYKRFTSLYTHS